MADNQAGNKRVQIQVHHEQPDGEAVETEMGRKKMKRWTMPDVPRWWQAKIIEYAFSHPHVRSRLEKHMGTNLVLLTDKAYMNELEDRIHEVNDENLNRRIAARVMDEMERLKKLILIGKTPLKECPPELYHHPVFVFWRQVNREVAKECKKRYQAYLRKLKTSQKIDFMLDEEVVEEGEEEEEVKLTPEEILQKCREELEEQKQEDLNNGFRFTDADFDLYKYETNDIKTLKSLSTVDELYTLADKIIGTKRL